MTPIHRTLLRLGGLLALSALAPFACSKKSDGPPPLVLAKTIELPGVEGRIDHMAADRLRKRLHVAARNNNSLETIDLEAGKVIGRQTGLVEPQGILLIEGSAPEGDRVVAACGGKGICWVGNAESLQRIVEVEVGAGADNLRHQPDTNRLYVATDAGFGVVDPNEWKLLGTIPTKGHPESFQLERQGRRIYANIPAAEQIAVYDRETRALATAWTLKNLKGNYPMALDEANRRLYVACREPAQLLVIDTAKGDLVGSADCGKDADDLFLDPERRRLYLSCGEGFLEVYEPRANDELKRTARIETRAGARTCLYVPKWKNVFVAVPNKDGAPAEIRVYDVR